MTMHNGVISDVRFQGDGCAISKATASLLTSEIKGKTQEEAERIIDIAQDAVTSSGDVELPPLLGKMSVIAGVREFPARVKCATLAMHTVKSALHGEHQATTE
jgi:nitrogen fixation NifU-like protein